MSPRIVLRGEAIAEFDEAFDWYDAQRPGLGTEFLTEIQAVFDRITKSPEAHPVLLADIRKVVVRRFPYLVFYRVRADHIEVLAVFHSKRDPST